MRDRKFEHSTNGGCIIYIDATCCLLSGDTGVGWILNNNSDVVIKAGSFAVGRSPLVEVDEGLAIFSVVLKL
ncbi:hypothetical protein Syun_017287 [Stephania yunnanensis]|uniref:Uncharacterized protein n=1 Tax=Stephania yunnanensis TaxID=152371 RepID=A0AAP0J889_9MAGN